MVKQLYKKLSGVLVIALLFSIFSFAPGTVVKAHAMEAGGVVIKEQADSGANPVEVIDDTGLIEAAATQGETLIVVGVSFDIATQVTVPAGADVTLDLNGQALTASVPFAIAVDGGSLTVIDSVGGGSIASNKDCVFCVYQGSLNLKAGDISSTSSTAIRAYGSDNPAATNFSNVTIEGTANVTAFYYGVLVNQRVAPAKPPEIKNYAYGVVVDVKGGSINVGNYSLYVNGLATGLGDNAPTFNISGGTIGSIYAAGYAHWNISGGDIIGVPYNSEIDGSKDPNASRATGMSGIEMKAGTLNMTGGTITVTGPAGYFSNSNGTSTNAYGIAAANYSSYAGNIDVNISGGTINSDADGVTLGILNVKDTTPTVTPVVSVTGGVFNGPLVVDSALGVNGFLRGGTFSAGAGIAQDWLDPGFVLANNAGGGFKVVPFVPVTGVTGMPAKATAGTPLALTGTAAPANATNRAIVWSIASAGTTGATISGATLNTNAAGTVIVTATIAGGKSKSAAFTQSFAIAVEEPPVEIIIVEPAAVTNIRIAQATFNVVKGKTLAIPFAYDLAAGETKTPVFTWTSNNNNVSVTQDGKVKGLVAGKSAKITVTADNGQTKTVTVNVAKTVIPVTSVSVSKAPKSMKIGQTATLNVKVAPAKATVTAATYSLDKKSAKVVSVDKAGKVTAKAKGIATITVKCGSVKTSVKIQVK